MTASIRQRLLITVLSLVILVSGTTLILSYNSAQHEIEEIFDAQMAQSARVLQTLLLARLAQNSASKISVTQPEALTTLAPKHLDKIVEANQYGHEYEHKIAFQVWNLEHQLILKSASAPTTPLSQSGLMPQNRGFSDENINQEYWRVFSVWDTNMGHLIQIGELHDVRNELTSEISANLLAPTAISLPILALFIWIGIGRGLAPVKNIVTEVTRRKPHYLEPMNIGPVPSEIRPLIRELNTLFKLLQDAFDRERRFTDDVAHELRTPLAALKTQAQVALRSNDDQERQNALGKVIKGVDRAAHLVEQMLVITRMNPQQENPQQKNCVLHFLAADVIAQVTPLARKKHISIKLTGDTKATIAAEPLSMSVLLRNIFDNAVLYSAPDSCVEINITVNQQHIVLSVGDNGPGIPAELHGRVFDRFYRVLGNEAQGCGLGLSIVKQIADRHSIKIELINKVDSRGLIINVFFKKPLSPSQVMGDMKEE